MTRLLSLMTILVSVGTSVGQEPQPSTLEVAPPPKLTRTQIVLDEARKNGGILSPAPPLPSFDEFTPGQYWFYPYLTDPIPKEEWAETPAGTAPVRSSSQTVAAPEPPPPLPQQDPEFDGLFTCCVGIYLLLFIGALVVLRRR